jgi:hypothetical protein
MEKISISSIHLQEECGRTQVRKYIIVEGWYKKERNETLKANHYRTNKYANPNSQLLVGLSVSRIEKNYRSIN